MADQKVTFDAPQNVSLDVARAEMEAAQGRRIEVVGNSEPASLEQALGLEEARGIRREPESRKITEEVLRNDDPSGGEEISANASRQLGKLEQQVLTLESEKGRYGREVVGPLRQENEALKERLDKIETQMQGNGAPTGEAPTTEQYARMMFGQAVDVKDPEVLQQTQFATTLLDAAERGTQAYVQPLVNEIKMLREQLSGTRELASTGLTPDQVQKAEAAFPELTELPESKRYALIRRLSTASQETAPRAAPQRDPNTGQFLPPNAHATASPENFVEGSSGMIGAGGTGEDRSQVWSRRMERFKEVGADREKGGARAQGHVFMDMLQSGEFNKV